MNKKNQNHYERIYLEDENGNITGTDQNFDVNTYKYLPPIFNGNNYEYFN